MLYRTELSKDFIKPSQCETEYVKNSNGDSIEFLWCSNRKTNGFKTYVYLHGNAGRLSFIVDGLLKSGNLLSPAYSGFSTSTGKPSTNNINEVVDLSIKFLRNKGFDDKNIIIVGHSLGGSPAVYSAVNYPNLNEVILINTFYSIKKMCEINYGPLCLFSNTIHNTAKIAPAAKAKIRQFHNPNDELIPFSQGQKLFNILGSNDKEFIEITGTHSHFPIDRLFVK